MEWISGVVYDEMLQRLNVRSYADGDAGIHYTVRLALQALMSDMTVFSYGSAARMDIGIKGSWRPAVWEPTTLTAEKLNELLQSVPFFRELQQGWLGAGHFLLRLGFTPTAGHVDYLKKGLEDIVDEVIPLKGEALAYLGCQVLSLSAVSDIAAVRERVQDLLRFSV